MKKMEFITLLKGDDQMKKNHVLKNLALVSIGVFLSGVLLSKGEISAFADMKLYVSPSCEYNTAKNCGVDAAGRGSSQAPLATLQGVQEELVRLNKENRIQENITVYIHNGVYQNHPSVIWTFRTGHTITFTSAEKISSSYSRPIFDGNGSAFFLDYHNHKDRPTTLVIENLQIQNYVNGITLRDNGAETPTKNHQIRNMVFTNIGNKYQNPKLETIDGYAAIRLIGVSNASLRNSTFKNLENTTGPAKIHAFYLANGSSNNSIVNHQITNVSGDPLRVRNNSNYNTFDNIRMIKTGQYALGLSEWRGESESASVENKLINSTVNKSYKNTSLPTVAFYDGVKLCTGSTAFNYAYIIKDGQTVKVPLIRTANNTRL